MRRTSMAMKSQCQRHQDFDVGLFATLSHQLRTKWFTSLRAPCAQCSPHRGTVMPANSDDGVADDATVPDDVDPATDAPDAARIIAPGYNTADEDDNTSPPTGESPAKGASVYACAWVFRGGVAEVVGCPAISACGQRPGS